MQHTIPLQEHPEFSIIEYPGWREYRVTTHARAYAASGLWLDACVVCGVAYCWQQIIASKAGIVLLAMVLVLYLRSRFTQVMWESVVVLPSLGLQLETHRGFGRFSLFATRKFIPWSFLEDFLINEGLRGWDVRYYTVAINRTAQGSFQLAVAFENLLPRFPIILAVYRGVQKAMKEENERCSNT